VLANAGLLASGGYSQLGYRLIQVDDGWQQAYGDWEPNTKFPGGLGSVAEELAANGQTVGVWTAPFLVSASADLARKAPDDWFVGDPATGERGVDPRHTVFGPMYALDARRPEVQQHLEATFARLYEEGVRYFKIDFLYAGAYAGIQALRLGVEAIRRGVRDAYLLACGAPLLPMAGLVDGCRVGQDTASPIYDFETGAPKPTIFGDEVAWVSRNVAARHFLHRWFQLDPDVALVGGNLTTEQGRQLVTLAALSGGPFFASDDLAALSPERLALLTNPAVLALVGAGAAVPDWEPGELDLPAAVWRRGDVLAVFNWSAEPREFPVLVPGRGTAHDLWQGTPAQAFESRLQVAVGAGSVRLLRLDKA